jgi:hypothetical protein
VYVFFHAEDRWVERPSVPAAGCIVTRQVYRENYRFMVREGSWINNTAYLPVQEVGCYVNTVNARGSGGGEMGVNWVDRVLVPRISEV